MSTRCRQQQPSEAVIIIAIRHEMMEELYTTISHVLITRFNEREDNVRLISSMPTKPC